jgi:hypothetical protein
MVGLAPFLNSAKKTLTKENFARIVGLILFKTL